MQVESIYIKHIYYRGKADPMELVVDDDKIIALDVTVFCGRRLGRAVTRQVKVQRRGGGRAAA